MASRSTNNFDFMRMALATTVIFSHSYDMLGRTNPFKRATGGQTELASVAVDVFFVLSGYLITQSFCSSHTVLDYFWKRILRLFPAFVVALRNHWIALASSSATPLPLAYIRPRLNWALASRFSAALLY